VPILAPHGEDNLLTEELQKKRAIAQDELQLVEQRLAELRRIIDGCNGALSAMDQPIVPPR
jgi:hypothetical protein